MSVQKEKIFAEGFSFKKRENSPDWIIGNQAIKVDEAIAFLQANQKKGWVNIDIKQSQKGTYYCELDTWEATPRTETPPAPAVNTKAEADLPF
jgi:hypothetical protein|tara:strand:- start:1383 stop:1661 length:279 start_codon:yes stop_codon:yes gene_type:complete